jgi:hypothetical protein
MSFHPFNRLLKIQKSIGTLILKVGAHLGVWGFIPSHSLTFPRNTKCDSWASLLARTFVNPCLGHEFKARIATLLLDNLNSMFSM